MKNTIFSPQALTEYLCWQQEDRKTLKRINSLIQSVHSDGAVEGIGKPERLKYIADAFSRRIDETNRLVYRIEKNRDLYIVSCKGHYDD